MPDHGKLMHLFLVRDQGLDALAHLHPIARAARRDSTSTSTCRDMPAGRYRVYGDIVHESGYAQTLVASVDLAGGSADSAPPTDPDDSWFSGARVPEAATVTYDLGGDTRLVWTRGDSPIVAGVERDLRFSVQDATGADVAVEPYMGMAAHLVVASRDGSVFAHLHPSGSVSMAAMQRFAGATAADAHAGHAMTLDGRVAVPYAFPKAGPYRAVRASQARRQSADQRIRRRRSVTLSLPPFTSVSLALQRRDPAHQRDTTWCMNGPSRISCRPESAARLWSSSK